MKLLLFLAVSLVVFFAVASWPALSSDWSYWRTARAYKRLHVGETKAQVERTFGLPPFTERSDRCWYDEENRWPGGAKRYTLCFDHGKLASKTVD